MPPSNQTPGGPEAHDTLQHYQKITFKEREEKRRETKRRETKREERGRKGGEREEREEREEKKGGGERKRERNTSLPPTNPLPPLGGKPAPPRREGERGGKPASPSTASIGWPRGGAASSLAAPVVSHGRAGARAAAGGGGGRSRKSGGRVVAVASAAAATFNRQQRCGRAAEESKQPVASVSCPDRFVSRNAAPVLPEPGYPGLPSRRCSGPGGV